MKKRQSNYVKLTLLLLTVFIISCSINKKWISIEKPIVKIIKTKIKNETDFCDIIYEKVIELCCCNYEGVSVITHFDKKNKIIKAKYLLFPDNGEEDFQKVFVYIELKLYNNYVVIIFNSNDKWITNKQERNDYSLRNAKKTIHTFIKELKKILN